MLWMAQSWDERMKPFAVIVKNAAKRVSEDANLVLLRQEADLRYKRLIKNANVPPLNTGTEKRVFEYAMDTFRSRCSASWLRFYAAFRGEFVEGCIPEDLYSRRVLQHLNSEFRTIAQAKTLTRRMLGAAEIPDLAYRVHGLWYDQNMQRIGLGELRDKLFSQHESVIMKLDNSMQGRGIKVFDRTDFNPDHFPGNSVVQRFVEQDPWFDQIITGSTSTLRILSALIDGTPRLIASHFRVGRSNERSIASRTRLLLSVDAQGRLGDFASDGAWRRYVQHPDTGFTFAKQQIPRFAEAVANCFALHQRVPQFQLVGWDLAIPSTGPLQILEWNMNHPGITFHEAASGPCFKGLGLEALAKG